MGIAVFRCTVMSAVPSPGRLATAASTGTMVDVETIPASRAKAPRIKTTASAKYVLNSTLLAGPVRYAHRPPDLFVSNHH
jgi:hypothetical protein